MAYNGIEAQCIKKSSGKGFFFGQIILRGMAAMATIASICVMVNSRQSIQVFGIELQAKYSYSSAFRFLFGTNITICALQVISLISICVFSGPKSTCKANFPLFLHDLIATILMMAGCAAATAIGYVGKYGQDQTGWTKICDNVKKFCHYITLSVVLSYLAFFCLFILTIMAFRRAQQLKC